MPTDRLNTLASQLSAVMDAQAQHLEEAVSRGIALLDEHYGGFLAESPDATYEPSLTASAGDMLQLLQDAALTDFGA